MQRKGKVSWLGRANGFNGSRSTDRPVAQIAGLRAFAHNFVSCDCIDDFDCSSVFISSGFDSASCVAPRETRWRDVCAQQFPHYTWTLG